MKKLVATFACGALAFACTAMPINAASGINVPEAELLDLVEKGITVGGEKISFAKGSDEYEALNQYLRMDGFELSVSGLDAIKGSVKDMQAFMEIHGEEEASAELMAQLIDLAAPAATALDMKVTYDPITDTLTISDSAGNVITTMENAFDLAQKSETPELPDTGEDFSSTYAIVGSLVAILAGAAYMTLKKKETLE